MPRGGKLRNSKKQRDALFKRHDSNDLIKEFLIRIKSKRKTPQKCHERNIELQVALLFGEEEVGRKYLIIQSSQLSILFAFVE